MINKRKAKGLLCAVAIVAVAWSAYPAVQSLEPERERAISAHQDREQLKCFQRGGLTLQEVADRNKKQCQAVLDKAREAVAGRDCSNRFEQSVACMDYEFFDMSQCLRTSEGCDQQLAVVPVFYSSNLAYLFTLDGARQLRSYIAVLLAALLLIVKGDALWKAFQDWITR